MRERERERERKTHVYVLGELTCTIRVKYLYYCSRFYLHATYMHTATCSLKSHTGVYTSKVPLLT